jgi:hypothetical protein
MEFSFFIDINEVGCKGVDWTGLIQRRSLMNCIPSHVNTAINHEAARKSGNFNAN